MKRRLSLWVQLIFLTLLLAISGALWFGREHVGNVFAALTHETQDGNGNARRRAGRKIPVVVARAGLTANDVTVEAVGTGRAKRFITLFPEASGEIIHLAVRAGDYIKRGETILRLEVRAAELAVNVAKTRLVDANRLMERSEQLLRKKINSQARVDDARSLSRRAELALSQAQETLSDRILTAPFDGVVGIPKVEVGDRVSQNTAIITLDDRGDLLVEFEVPELYISRLSSGQTVLAKTSSFGEKRFIGKIEQIDTRVNPTSRSVTIRAVLPNSDDLLRPGMSFAVEINLSGKTFPTVPELALLWGKGESYVWRIAKGRAEKIPVRIVRRLNSVILVDGDISEGDLVVVEGVQRLRPGRAVTFLSPPPRPSKSVRSQLESKND